MGGKKCLRFGRCADEAQIASAFKRSEAAEWRNEMKRLELLSLKEVKELLLIFTFVFNERPDKLSLLVQLSLFIKHNLR